MSDTATRPVHVLGSTRNNGGREQPMRYTVEMMKGPGYVNTVAMTPDGQIVMNHEGDVHVMPLADWAALPGPPLRLPTADHRGALAEEEAVSPKPPHCPCGLPLPCCDCRDDLHFRIADLEAELAELRAERDTSDSGDTCRARPSGKSWRVCCS